MADKPTKDALNDLNLDPALKDLDKQAKDAKTKEPDSPPKDDQPGQWPGPFKTDADKLTGYKELQGAYTRTTQENKDLKEQMAQLRAKLEELEGKAGLGKPTFLPGDNPGLAQFNPHAGSGEQEDFDPYDEKSLDARINKQVEMRLMANLLKKEHIANPTEFNDRLSYVHMLAQQYPQYAMTADGLETLFGEADKYRVEHTKKMALRGLEHLLGRTPSEEELARFRQSFGTEGQVQTQTQPGGSSAGYMPDSTGSARTGADTVQTAPDLSKEIDEAVEKGDYLQTAGLLLQRKVQED